LNVLSVHRRDAAAGVHAAELWNPTTGVWTTLASNSVNRVYHSTSILLPDGRVLHAGSGDSGPDQRTGELFSPPYLFEGARPAIESSPAQVGYGASFSLTTPDAAATWFQKALAVWPDSYLALAGEARAQAALGHTDAAIAGYMQAIAIAPQPDALTALGDLYTLRGDAKLAAKIASSSSR